MIPENLAQEGASLIVGAEICFVRKDVIPDSLGQVKASLTAGILLSESTWYPTVLCR